MSDPAYLKCTCPKCGGHIEFPAASAGATTACPHCGVPILLAATEPPPSPAAPVIRKSNRVWLYLVLVVVILLILPLAKLGLTIYKSKMSNSAPPQPPPTVAPAAPAAPVIHTNPVKPVVYTQIHDFSIGPITLKKTPGSGLVYAVGTVINATDRQRFGVKIQLDMLDAQGETLGTTSDYISDLEPRKSWSFNALLTVPKVARVKLVDIEEQ
jgi:hypothetical protein